MIRFAPQPASTSSSPGTRATAETATPLKATLEIQVVVPAMTTDASEGMAESGMLLAELPEASPKARSPRKPKAKPEAAATQLDLNT